MEIIFFLIIVVLSITINSKITKLITKTKALEDKIDNLEYLQYKNSKTNEASLLDLVDDFDKIKTPKKEILITEGEAVENKSVPNISKEHVITEKIEKPEILEKSEINPPEITHKPTSRKPISAILKERLLTFKKNNPDIEKFIGENLISKIGILILVLGISFFVKFAIDQDWINEFGRVGIGFLAGGILLGFAHKLQRNYKAFSSVLVSGAITVFYFIITYAFKEYGLFSQTIAFGLLVLVTIFSVFISIMYDRKELGILSLLGGFSVPLLTSTGSGNYIVLFSYLSIINIGFLIVSIKKKWFIINVLTFIFTHIFFLAWIFNDIKIESHSTSLFLFASLFYLVFFLMNVFRIIREKEYAMKPIVISLFLVSTFVYFGQGLYLLDFFAPSFKGLFTLLLSFVNLATGWYLLKNKLVDNKAIYLFIGMTLTFLTLVGPIQLEGNYITLFWAAESTLLFWLAKKIKTRDLNFVGFIVIILMLGSLLMDFEKIYGFPSENLQIIFNKGFITGIFSIVTLIISALIFHQEKSSFFIRNIKFDPAQIKVILIGIAGIVFYLTGLLELSYQSKKYFDPFLAFTLIVIYNYIFIAIGIKLTLSHHIEKVQSVGLLSSIAALIYSNYFIGSIPFRAFFSSIQKSTTNPTFFVQFILLAISLYIIFQVYKYTNHSQKTFRSTTIIKYFIASIFVIAISLEVLIIIEPIVVLPKIDTDSNIYGIVSHAKIAIIKTVYPILWGLLSFVFLFFGIKNAKKEWRIFALVLIAITIVKLFTYDIGNVSQGGKIIAFILLGIVLLIISFMYQKIKNALFNDEIEDNSSNNN